MKIYIQGAYIDSELPYVKISYSNKFEVTRSDKDEALVIKIPPGFKWSDIADRRITVYKDQVIKQTDFRKVPDAVYNLCGLTLRKTIPVDYSVSQYRLEGIKDYTMLWNNDQAQIFIPATLAFDFDRYINLISQNPYLEVLNADKLNSFNNFYGVNLSDKSFEINSLNDYVFKPKGFYERYILRSIDIQDAFISQVRAYLSQLGIELKRRPIDENAQNIARVLYSFTEIDKQTSRRSGLNPLSNVVQHSMHIDFELTSPDLPLIDDFKHRYSNIDGLTKLTTFDTKDTLGNYWSSTIDWQPISTDFTSDYDQDSLGNSANKLNFSADVYYCTVYDHIYYDIQQIVIDLIRLQDKFYKIKT